MDLASCGEGSFLKKESQKVREREKEERKKLFMAAAASDSKVNPAIEALYIYLGFRKERKNMEVYIMLNILMHLE